MNKLPHVYDQKKDRIILSLLFLNSLVFTSIIFFIDERRYSLDFLTKINEIISLATFTSFFVAIPIALYFSLDRLSFKSRLFLSFIVGFLPPYFLIWCLL